MVRFQPIGVSGSAQRCPTCGIGVVHVRGWRSCDQCNRGGPYHIAVCVGPCLSWSKTAEDAAAEEATRRPCVCAALGRGAPAHQLRAPASAAGSAWTAEACAAAHVSGTAVGLGGHREQRQASARALSSQAGQLQPSGGLMTR